MARLIDADAIIDFIDMDSTWDPLETCFSERDVVDMLESAPTVDAVEVVRCKDCAVPHNNYTGCPELNGLVTPPDFYCPFGERKKVLTDGF